MHLNKIRFQALRKLRLNGRTDLEKPSFGSPIVTKKINIFIGPNGGGKSTIVDLIRSINNPYLLTTLPRENMRNDTLSGFVLYFNEGVELIGVMCKTDITEYGIDLLLSIGGVRFRHRGVFKEEVTDGDLSMLNNVYNFIPAKVAYRNSHDEKGIDISHVVTVMNDERLCFDGLISTPLAENGFCYDGPPGMDLTYVENNPVQIEDEKELLLSIWLNDDRLQSNRVKLDMLPSGWRAFCGLLAWLKEQTDGCICVIEEPETHIHPHLLRKMIVRVLKISKEKDLQLFITTHSSILMDLNLWDSEDIALFEVDSNDVNVLTDPFRLLSNLGVKPSDINHANGIIWVEGPSDRLYILHWLHLLCKKNGTREFLENNHFCILIYGGSILTHLTGNDEENYINIFKVNKNSLVVIDRDLDFKLVEGELIPVNDRVAKNKIRESVPSVVTDYYTIESYLPFDFFNVYFYNSDEKVKKKSNLSKVEIARRYCNDYSSYDNCFRDGSGAKFIQIIYDSIVQWNC